MGKINQKAEPSTKSHLNWMGGKSFDIKNPLLRLRIAASSCFFGEPQYYHRDEDEKSTARSNSHGGVLDSNSLNHLRETLDAIDPVEWRSKSPAQILTESIDSALEVDPEGTLAFAAELRQDMNIRVTPQVIMVRAAHRDNVKGTDLIARYANKIMQRMDEPATQMAYQLSAYGKPIPSLLKRAWARRLEKAKPYELAKYRQEGREVNIFDVVNVCHPASDTVSKLMKGKLKLGDEEKTWESIRSAGGSWEEAAEVMHHMALLRNLRNLEAAGALTPKLLAKLEAGVVGGRQLPFRYFSAYNELKESGARSAVLDSVESCLEKSFSHVPHFNGRVMSLVDNSGSAVTARISSMSKMNVATIGNLMGVITARASDDGHVGVFGDKLDSIQIRKKASVFDQLEQVNKTGDSVGQSTENGVWLFWDQAIRDEEHWDHVFIYSDMQAGHGGLYGVGDRRSPHPYPLWPGSSMHIDVPALVRRYRKEVNPNVFVYLVQIAGYRDTLFPESYNRTFILGGWSESILRYASEMTKVLQ
jgi:hypothetical protein